MEMMATLLVENRTQAVYGALITHTGFNLGTLVRNEEVLGFLRAIEEGRQATLVFEDISVEFLFQPGKGVSGKKAGALNWSALVSM